ncbi:MAG: cystathionine beta-lyase [Oceanicaulis sp.]|jgi:cystathionine beta-lyase|nr:cystathionine beta-lyase [Oceanicaulis sp.]
MKRDTRLIHSGQPRRSDDLVNPPIERASTVVAPSTAELYSPTPPRRHYGRGGLSPNTELRDAIAQLYEADHVALAQSGLASVILALRTALPEQPSGMQALITDSAYGPVRRFCDEELPRYGVTPVYYDPRIGADISTLLAKPTALVLLEAPGSLTFEVQDIAAIARAARDAGAASVIDDTWSAGLLMNPLDLGVDYAAQALTKYVGGHSDFLMGAVAARGDAAARLKDKDVLFGGHVSPDDAYLCLRGLRTLSLRIERSGASGLALARQLETHPKVAWVLHPGLESHPDHALFSRQFNGSSGCFAFVLDGLDARAGEAIAESLHLFRLGFSWGGYESLILPCDRQIRRTAVPWTAEGALLRLSVGLEDVDDLWADLAQALG